MFTRDWFLCAQLCDLYENDCIFDKFDCTFSGSGGHLATGTYTNSFRVLSVDGLAAGNAGADTTLEASRDPQRKRLLAPAKVSLCNSMHMTEHPRGSGQR